MSTIHEFKNKEKIILSDYLALERTRLANERTFFSYLRTSMYLLLAGIAFFELQGFEKIKWMGYISMILSIVVLVVGIIAYYRLKYKLKKFYSQTPNETTEEG